MKLVNNIAEYWNQYTAYRLKKEAKELISQGDVDAALERYEKIVSIYPTAEAWTDEATIYKDKKEPEKALKCLEEAFYINSKFERGLLLKLDILYEKGDLVETIKTIDTIVKIYPGNLKALTLKAKIFEDENKNQEALDCYNKIINKILEENITYVDICINKGRLLYKMEKYPEAIESLENAQRLDPNNPILPRYIENIKSIEMDLKKVKE